MKALVPECKIDSLVVESLGFSFDDYDHKKGNGNVSRVMQQNLSAKIIGIIDNDKRKPEYFTQFISLNTNYSSVELLQHPQNKNHYIILLKPAADDFIFNLSLSARIEPSQFGLANDKETFRRQCKKVELGVAENIFSKAKAFRK